MKTVAAPRNVILQGDARERLAELPKASVDMVVFSPPYVLARNYGVEGQMGNEGTVAEWVESLRQVMREIARVLRPTGSCFVNVADSYSKSPQFGAPAKSALLAPERLLIALAADGWIVRNKALWVKTNGQPSSVKDRLVNRYEHVFFLTRSRHYFFDLDAVRRPHVSRGRRLGRRPPSMPPSWAGPLAGTQAGLYKRRVGDLPGDPLGANPGDVLTLATAAFRGPHHAVYPKGLPGFAIRAACPERVCGRCGRPWTRGRVVLGKVLPAAVDPTRTPDYKVGRGQLRPSCSCQAPAERALVLDPFMGSGTTAVVASELGRDFLGVEINADFIALAQERLRTEVHS